MDNQKIIIILLCVIIAILAAGILAFSPFMAKEDSNIAIADKKIHVGDSLVVKLTDSNGNPISNGTVNVKLTDKNGAVKDEDIVTNSKGEAKYKMDEKGKYSVECRFNGDNKHSSSATAGNITVETVETEVVNNEESGNSVSQSQDSDKDESRQREEYQITPDGWDPKEHEVSREPLDNGHERVRYDDGYMRVVDEDGNIISYGW